MADKTERQQHNQNRADDKASAWQSQVVEAFADFGRRLNELAQAAAVSAEAAEGRERAQGVAADEIRKTISALSARFDDGAEFASICDKHSAQIGALAARQDTLEGTLRTVGRWLGGVFAAVCISVILSGLAMWLNHVAGH